MNNKITAKEARETMNSVNMKELLLNRIYRSIRHEASDGQNNTMRYVDEFEMNDVKSAIEELEKDGFFVKLKRAGLVFKRIGIFSKIVVKW